MAIVSECVTFVNGSLPGIDCSISEVDSFFEGHEVAILVFFLVLAVVIFILYLLFRGGGGE